MIHAGREETLRLGERAYRDAQERMLLTPHQYRARGLKDTYETDIKPLNKYRYFLLYILIPSVDKAGELSFRAKAIHESTVAIVALHRWRLDRGEYPASLAELVDAEYLATVPDDPFSAGPLVYRREGEDFILYSVARDFEDNSGTRGKPGWADWGDPETPGDCVFWPVAGPAD